MNRLFELFKSLNYDRDTSDSSEKMKYFTVVDAYSLVWMDTLPKQKEKSYCPRQRENIIKRNELRANNSDLMLLFADTYYEGFKAVCEEYTMDYSSVDQKTIRELALKGQMGIVNPFGMLKEETYKTFVSRKKLSEEVNSYRERKF